MPAQYRTTISATIWTDTPEEVDQYVAAIRDDIPEADREAVFATIQYVPDGRPEPPGPQAMMMPQAQPPEGEDEP